MNELRDRIARHLKQRRRRAKLAYFHERRQQMLGQPEKQWYSEIMRSGWSMNRKQWREDQQKCKGDKKMDIEISRQTIDVGEAIEQLRGLSHQRSQCSAKLKLQRLGVILECFLFAPATLYIGMFAMSRSEQILVTLTQILHTIKHQNHKKMEYFEEEKETKFEGYPQSTWKALFLQQDEQILWIGIQISHDLAVTNGIIPSYWSVRCLLFRFLTPIKENQNSFLFKEQNRSSEQSVKYSILLRFLTAYSPFQSNYLKILSPTQIIHDYLHFIDTQLIAFDVSTFSSDLELYCQLIQKWQSWGSKRAIQISSQPIISVKAITNIQNLIKSQDKYDISHKMMEDIECICMKLLKICISPSQSRSPSEKNCKLNIPQENEVESWKEFEGISKNQSVGDWIQSNFQLLELVKSMKLMRES